MSHPASPSAHRRVRILSRGRLVALAFVLLMPLAVGCTGLLQNIGARWVTRQIADEFDLDEAQTEATRTSVDRLLAEAPGVLGPKVELLVATADRAIAKGFDEETVIRLERQMDKMLDLVAGRIIDEASPILATLRDEQIDHAEGRIRERLDKAREELSEPVEERLKKRQDEFVDAVTSWAGDLSNAQERKLRAYVAGLPDEAAARLASDERRLDQIADVLRNHPGAAAVRDALWDAWKAREDWGPHARPAEARRVQRRQTLIYVYGLLNDRQKDHASKRLHELHEKVKRFLGLAES